MCLYVPICVIVLAMGLFVTVCMYFWSFIHVSFAGTQCGFFPLCVPFFCLFTDLLLMLYSVLCVLCISYILCMTMCILFQLGAL